MLDSYKKRRRVKLRALAQGMKEGRACAGCGEDNPQKLGFYRNKADQRTMVTLINNEVSVVTLVRELEVQDLICCSCYHVRKNMRRYGLLSAL